MELGYDSSRFIQIYPFFDPTDGSRPVGRSGHCMSSDDSDFYMYGGYSPADDRNGIAQNTVLSELWKFSFATEEWTKVDAAETPTTCASACIKVRNKQVFVFGGTGYPFGHVMSNTLKTVNLRPLKNLEAAGEKSKNDCCSQNVWQLVETNPMSYSAGGDEEDLSPSPAYGQSLMFYKDHIYVFGGAVGYYSEAVAMLHRLNTDTLTWEKLRPTGKGPSGRYKQEIAEDAENFYVFGGGRLYFAESLEKIYKYNYTQNHWTELHTLPDSIHGFPKARCSFGFAQSGHDIFVTGGRHYRIEVEHEALSDIWHFRLDTLKWKRLHISLPKPLYFHSSVISPAGYMYIFGGVLPDGMRSPYVCKLRLPRSVPKLVELSWDNVCHLLRTKRKVSQEVLAGLGVPWNLVERVCQ